MKKIRADQRLVDLGLAPSRTKAQSLIMAGVVLCGTERVNKPAQLISSESPLTLKGKDHDYVSRGGVKLKAAIDHFKIEVKDKICCDVGASTGGFTDCLLKEGAKKVYAIDVGYGQLNWALQKDPRVMVMDRINFRHFDVNTIENPIDLVTIDVSFISLTKIIPKVIELFQAHPPISPSPPLLICLIKPQFEVGKENVGKGGIVKDEKKQKECVEKIKTFCEESGFEVKGTISSPIQGQEGNQEFLMAMNLTVARAN